MTEIILYQCDCKKKCSEHKGCHLNGGECTHTQNINHAVNFHKTEAGSFKEGKKIGHIEKNDMTDDRANVLP